MNLTELIPFLQDPSKLEILYKTLSLDQDSEAILIYLRESLHLENDIALFEVEKTKDGLNFNNEDLNYIQLMPISLAEELVTNDFCELNTEIEIASRLIEYRKNDA